MLTIQTEIKLTCPGCGELIDFDATVNIDNKIELDCPHCNNTLFLSVICQLTDITYLKTNAGALLELLQAENDLQSLIAESIVELIEEKKTIEKAVKSATGN
jgi:C4-type Zn-finger protein